MPWIDEAHTLLQAFYGGNELGNGLADVLFGKINPSGKLPLTFPWVKSASGYIPDYFIESDWRMSLRTVLTVTKHRVMERLNIMRSVDLEV